MDVVPESEGAVLLSLAAVVPKAKAKDQIVIGC